ncbi:MAG: GNAT family N-acetyltransferase [Elusimicrobiaceae bacterium]
MNGVTVSRAGHEDLFSIFEIDGACEFSGHWSVDGYKELLKNPGGVLLKAEKDGKIYGFIAGRLIPPEAEIDNIAVCSGFRRNGLGGFLLSGFIALVREGGCGSVYLEVNEHNIAALGFYERAGFSGVGRRPGYYRGREDAILMRLNCE